MASQDQNQDRKTTHTSPHRTCKVMLLGDGASGKSSLLQYLQRMLDSDRTDRSIEHSILGSERIQTRGIDHVRLEIDGYATLDVWDCAGQLQYCSTHSLFFSAEAAIYCIILSFDPTTAATTRSCAILEQRVAERCRFWLTALQAKCLPDRRQNMSILFLASHVDKYCEWLTEIGRDKSEQRLATAEAMLQRTVQAMRLEFPTLPIANPDAYSSSSGNGSCLLDYLNYEVSKECLGAQTLRCGDRLLDVLLPLAERHAQVETSTVKRDDHSTENSNGSESSSTSSYSQLLHRVEELRQRPTMLPLVSMSDLVVGTDESEEQRQQALQLLHRDGYLLFVPGCSTLAISPSWFSRTLARFIGPEGTTFLADGRRRHVLHLDLVVQALRHPPIGGESTEITLQHARMILDLAAALNLCYPLPDTPLYLVPCLAPRVTEEETSRWFEVKDPTANKNRFDGRRLLFWPANTEGGEKKKPSKKCSLTLPPGLFGALQVILLRTPNLERVEEKQQQQEHYENKTDNAPLPMMRQDCMMLREQGQDGLLRVTASDYELHIIARGQDPSALVQRLCETAASLVRNVYPGLRLQIRTMCPSCVREARAMDAGCRLQQCSCAMLNRAVSHLRAAKKSQKQSTASPSSPLSLSSLLPGCLLSKDKHGALELRLPSEEKLLDEISPDEMSRQLLVLEAVAASVPSTSSSSSTSSPLPSSCSPSCSSLWIRDLDPDLHLARFAHVFYARKFRFCPHTQSFVKYCSNSTSTNHLLKLDSPIKNCLPVVARFLLYRRLVANQSDRDRATLASLPKQVELETMLQSIESMSSPNWGVAVQLASQLALNYPEQLTASLHKYLLHDDLDQQLLFSRLITGLHLISHIVWQVQKEQDTRWFMSQHLAPLVEHALSRLSDAMPKYRQCAAILVGEWLQKRLIGFSTCQGWKATLLRGEPRPFEGLLLKKEGKQHDDNKDSETASWHLPPAMVLQAQDPWETVLCQLQGGCSKRDVESVRIVAGRLEAAQLNMTFAIRLAVSKIDSREASPGLEWLPFSQIVRDKSVDSHVRELCSTITSGVQSLEVA